MSQNWLPEADSLAARMIFYFSQAPAGTKLNRMDVKANFNVAGAHVDAMLRPAVDVGAIAVQMDDEAGRCWLAGPNLARYASPSAFKQWLGADGKAGAPRAAPLPDPGDLRARIKAGVPIPERMPSAVVRYHAVLSVMEPGDSFEVDRAVSRRLMKTVTEWARLHNRRFLLRDLDATTSGIWRVDGLPDAPATEVVSPRRGGRRSKATSGAPA